MPIFNVEVTCTLEEGYEVEADNWQEAEKLGEQFFRKEYKIVGMSSLEIFVDEIGE